MIPFCPIFEDANVLVLEKSAGVLSQGDHTGEASLVDHLRTYFGRHYVGLIHRLDRNTSGLMVIGKRSKSADRLSAQLREGILDRAYLAILEGVLKAPAIWEDVLLKDAKTNQTRVFSGTTRPKDATQAKLHVKPLKSSAKHTLALFTLETGRSHQIRVQSAHRRLPLVGDTKYGGRPESFLALHSAFLKFEHPIDKNLRTFALPPPNLWRVSFPELFDSNDTQEWIDQIQPFK